MTTRVVRGARRAVRGARLVRRSLGVGGRAVRGALLAGILLADTAWAQTPVRPRAEVTPAVETTPVRAGAVTRLSLRVRLPKDVHVQSNTPRDPSLIPTVLTLDAPAGVTVDAIHYPKATDLAQAKRKDALAVYGPAFEIGVTVLLAPSVPAGELAVPATLRYQACNDTVCFPPARATARWTLNVTKD